MNCTFYKNLSDNNKVRKNISAIKNVGGIFLKDGCSMHNPIIIIGKSSLPYIRNANYAYIDTFGRYYYVNDIVAGTAETLEISMTVDPLMSFANEIYSLKCVIDRQENLFNKKIVDQNAPVRVNRIVSYKKIGDFPFSKSIVLTVDGGRVE